MISPKDKNRPIRVSSMVLNTEPKSNERYHRRSVHTLVKIAKTMIRTAAMINVGRMALRRPACRILLTRFFSSDCVGANPAADAVGGHLSSQPAYAAAPKQAWNQPLGTTWDRCSPFRRLKVSQCTDGLKEGFHPNQGHVRLQPGKRRAVGRRNQKRRGAFPLGGGHLLLDGADAADITIRRDGSGARHVLALEQRTLGEFVVYRHREHQASARTADLLSELKGDRGLIAIPDPDVDSDYWNTGLARGLHGGHGHLGLGSLTENHKVNLLANLVSADQSLDHLSVSRGHAVDRDHQISRQQSVVGRPANGDRGDLRHYRHRLARG